MKNSLTLLKRKGLYPLYKFKVASRSEPGAYHIVKVYKPNRWDCDCIGFAIAGNCHHIKKAREVLSQAIKNKHGKK